MLQVIPLVFVLAGLVLYVVLGGADFGAGLWLALAGRGERAERLREHAHHSMAPVWEANHVWLIFVLTVTWTAYPTFFGSMASTLAVPLFLAGLGIILRGASYALREGSASRRELRAIDTAFASASLITPFALGTAAGALAAERVPVGNAAGHLLSSWTGPVSWLVGALAVIGSGYLAAVYLAADAARTGDTEARCAYRTRALVSGALAGLLALAGLIVLHADARSLLNELFRGGALAAVIVSALAGVATLALVWTERYEPARYSASLAVAAMVAGWALARYPTLLPGLTVRHAAASHDTLVTLIVAVVAGGLLLAPSLGWLFRLTLAGRFDPDHDAPAAPPPRPTGRALRTPGPRPVIALLIIGVGLLNVAGAPWAHAIGVVSLLGFVIVGSAAIVGRVLGEEPGPPDAQSAAGPIAQRRGAR